MIEREFHGRVLADGRITWDFPSQVAAYRRHLYARTGDGAITAMFYPLRTKRSDRQNRAMWSLLNEWCREADQGWRPDELKDAVMGIVFGTIEVTQPLTGLVITSPAKLHTSSLSVADFCRVIDAILELAATTEPAVFLDAPDEHRKAKALAEKKSAKKAA